MCGIVGFLDPSVRGDRDGLLRLAELMATALWHRGPDDGGSWADPAAGVALGFRRLAIRELTLAGHQPMESQSGRWVIAFNGEIYSDDEIRVQLQDKGISLRGTSDTEVIVEGVSNFGVDRTLSQLNGMFAIALWDRSERELWLIRDRLGIKPLYWAHFGSVFLFGSELKALRVHGAWSGTINRDIAASYLRFGYVPSPYSIYSGVHMLRPGCVLRIKQGEAPHIEHYWNTESVLGSAVRNRIDLSDEEAIDRLEDLLLDSVKRRMVADVPLGAFISGGIDSSTVVALLQRLSSRKVKTFTIGFDEAAYNEAPYARRVAEHLGTEHTEVYVTEAHARDVIPRLPQIYDEPFADSSQIPTLLVSELTKRDVTVALSGDGGDELFAGYNRYAFAQKIRNHVGVLPYHLRQLARSAVHAVTPENWDRLLSPLPASIRSRVTGDRLHKAAYVLAYANETAMYRTLVSNWNDPELVVRHGREPRGLLWDDSLSDLMPSFVEKLQYADLNTYLPDDILTKVDRASMAVALEVRVPLLDYRIVEFAFHLSPHLKMRHGCGKWLLRQVLFRYVPRQILERPKMGFGVPIGRWLRGPLRPWAEELLNERRLSIGGLVEPAPVRKMWAEHLAGRRNHQYPLWTILMLESWREHWKL